MKYYKEIILAIVSLLGVIFPVGIIMYLLVFGMKAMDKEVVLMIGTLIGIVVREYSTVFQYHLGSSSGSKSKQDAIDKLTSADKSTSTDVDKEKSIKVELEKS